MMSSLHAFEPGLTVRSRVINLQVPPPYYLPNRAEKLARICRRTQCTKILTQSIFEHVCAYVTTFL